MTSASSSIRSSRILRNRLSILARRKGVVAAHPGAAFVAAATASATSAAFAIGTNPGITRFTKNTLLDEKISGTVHMALGQSFPNVGGLNTSALHWDMVTNMRQGTITVDDVVIYKNGEFVV